MGDGRVVVDGEVGMNGGGLIGLGLALEERKFRGGTDECLSFWKLALG